MESAAASLSVTDYKRTDLVEYMKELISALEQEQRSKELVIKMEENLRFNEEVD